MVSYLIRRDPVPPPSKRWLASRFPHRGEWIAELRRRIERAPAAIAVSPPEPGHFGMTVERALALDLCDAPPYPYLFASLPEAARRRLLATAGYQPVGEAPDTAWRRTGACVPAAARLFTVASLLTDLDQTLRGLRPATPEHTQRVLRVPLRHRDTVTLLAGRTRAVRPAFAPFWASYASGFRAALRSYGVVIAAPALLDGLRVADLLAGTTIVELKTGHVTDTGQFHDLIDQLLTYALLAPISGHPVTAVVAYLARYHVLARYPVDALTTALAGEPVDLPAAGHDLADLIRAEHPTCSAA